MKYFARIYILLITLVICGPLNGCAYSAKTDQAKPKQILIVTGQDYPGHKWKLTAPVLANMFRKDTRLRVNIVEKPIFLASDKLHNYDVVVLHFMDWKQPGPGTKARKNLRKFVNDGKGLFIVHFACGAFQEWPEFRNLAGKVWDPKLGHDPIRKFRVNIIDKRHPITRGLSSFDTVDELYTCLTGERAIRILATARSIVDGKDYPIAFSFNYGKGRVFHSPLGHDVRSLDNSHVAELFRRGCAWTAFIPPVPKNK